MSARLLEVRGLTVRLPLRRAGLLATRHWLTAVDGVDLEVAAGQSVGIVGEAGCGKSTLARANLAHLRPAAGSVPWRGTLVRPGDAPALRRMRREAQVVFQDPVGSLDPRMTVGESVAEALVALAGPQPRAARDSWVAATLQEVGLDPALAARYPHELSGGQCQRAAIAPAIVARHDFLKSFIIAFEQSNRYFKKQRFNDLVEEWKSQSDTLGKKVRVKTMTEDLEGTTLDVDSSGFLLLKTRTGDTKKILSGDCLYFDELDHT